MREINALKGKRRGCGEGEASGGKLR